MLRKIVIMVVADGLAPIQRQAICNHYHDVGQLVQEWQNEEPRYLTKSRSSAILSNIPCSNSKSFIARPSGGWVVWCGVRIICEQRQVSAGSVMTMFRSSIICKGPAREGLSMFVHYACWQWRYNFNDVFCYPWCTDRNMLDISEVLSKSIPGMSRWPINSLGA